MSNLIPEPAVKRMPMYYRYMQKLETEGRIYISSRELAELTGLTASQVRQDMNFFGSTGRQGCGYPVAEIRYDLGRLLGLDREQSFIIVGMGNLGMALVHYEPLAEKGFVLSAAFDNAEEKIGMCVGGIAIQPMNEIENVVKMQSVKLAVLTLPSNTAQEVGERLYQAGIRGFWNFAPVDLYLPQDASIVNVHLDASLEMLSYRMAHADLF